MKFPFVYVSACVGGVSASEGGVIGVEIVSLSGHTAMLSFVHFGDIIVSIQSAELSVLGGILSESGKGHKQ